MERIAVIRFGSMSTNRKIRVLVVSTDPRVTALADAVKVAPLIGSQVTVAVPDMDRARLWLLEHPAANAIAARKEKTKNKFLISFMFNSPLVKWA